jgi:hypothetical protein
MGVNEHFEPIYNDVSCQLRGFKTASYLELRNMLYNGVIIASLVFTPNRIIGDS